MATLARPLPLESLGLVVVVLLAGGLSRLVKDQRPTPVSRWPWRPTPGEVGYRGEIDNDLGEALPWMRGGGNADL